MAIFPKQQSAAFAIHAWSLVVWFSCLLADSTHEQRIQPEQLPATDGEEEQSLERRISAFQSVINSVPETAFSNQGSEEVHKLVSDFYERIEYRLAWFDGGRALEIAYTLIGALRNSAREGLRSEFYKPDEFARQIGVAQREGNAALLRADVSLTTGFMVHGLHLLQGQLRPSQLNIDWNVKPRQADLPELLHGAVTERDLIPALKSLLPPHPEYERLRQLRSDYELIAQNGGWPMVPEGPALKPGEPALVERLRALRERLTIEGYHGGPPITGIPKITGQAERYAIEQIEEEKEERRQGSVELPQTSSTQEVYPEQLANAVGKFQLAHGIEVDTIVGGQTLAELNIPAEQRLRQIELNMERWRWLPESLGSFDIRVNLPAFHLRVMKNNALVIEMNVIIGKEGWGTPVFSDEVEKIVVNPDWTVPQSILDKELMPIIRRDRSYLKRNNFVSVPGGGLRQKPGPMNPLGQYKFVFPNEHAIYLHATPKTALFNKRDRALSHGCIRVERPLDLAAVLLQGEPGNWTREQLSALADTNRTQEIKLVCKVPVHLLYWTVYCREESVEFHQDIYRMDQAMIRALDEMTKRK